MRHRDPQESKSSGEGGFAFCCAAFAVFAAGALRHAAAADTPVQANSSAEAGGLEEVIVTSRRREESLDKIPESVTVFTATQIEDARIRRIDDFVAMTPGFEIHDGESPAHRWLRPERRVRLHRR